MMRTTYREALEGVISDLVLMGDAVEEAVQVATTALLETNLAAAESVISGDKKLDAWHDDLEYRCFSLLARQAPVAGELRQVVAALRMIADLARMGDLAAHVAKIARLRYPLKAVPDVLTENFAQIAELAESMVHNGGRALKDRSISLASSMADTDEEIDALREEQFQVMLSPSWSAGVEAAVDVALLGRYYERIADHAVLLASRVIYIVTGEVPDGDNWTIA